MIPTLLWSALLGLISSAVHTSPSTMAQTSGPISNPVHTSPSMMAQTSGPISNPVHNPSSTMAHFNSLVSRLTHILPSKMAQSSGLISSTIHIPPLLMSQSGGLISDPVYTHPSTMKHSSGLVSSLPHIPPSKMAQSSIRIPLSKMAQSSTHIPPSKMAQSSTHIPPSKMAQSSDLISSLDHTLPSTLAQSTDIVVGMRHISTPAMAQPNGLVSGHILVPPSAIAHFSSRPNSSLFPASPATVAQSDGHSRGSPAERFLTTGGEKSVDIENEENNFTKHLEQLRETALLRPITTSEGATSHVSQKLTGIVYRFRQDHPDSETIRLAALISITAPQPSKKLFMRQTTRMPHISKHENELGNIKRMKYMKFHKSLQNTDKNVWRAIPRVRKKRELLDDAVSNINSLHIEPGLSTKIGIPQKKGSESTFHNNTALENLSLGPTMTAAVVNFSVDTNITKMVTTGEMVTTANITSIVEVNLTTAIESVHSEDILVTQTDPENRNDTLQAFKEWQPLGCELSCSGTNSSLDHSNITKKSEEFPMMVLNNTLLRVTNDTEKRSPVSEISLEMVTNVNGKMNQSGSPSLEQGILTSAQYYSILYIIRVIATAIVALAVITAGITVIVFGNPKLQNSSKELVIAFNVTEGLKSACYCINRIFKILEAQRKITWASSYAVFFIHFVIWAPDGLGRMGLLLNSIITLDRFIVLAFPLKRMNKQLIKYPLITVAVVVVSMLAYQMSSVVLFQTEVVPHLNYSVEFEEDQTVSILALTSPSTFQKYRICLVIAGCLFHYLPLCIALVFNTLTIISLKRHEKLKRHLTGDVKLVRQQLQKKQTNKMLVVSSLAFAVVVALKPLVNILSSLLPDFGQAKREVYLHNIVLEVAVLLDNVSPIVNLISYSSLSSAFRKHLGLTFVRKSRQNSSSSGSEHRSNRQT